MTNSNQYIDNVFDELFENHHLHERTHERIKEAKQQLILWRDSAVIAELEAMQREWYGHKDGSLDPKPDPADDWLGADLYDRIATLNKEK